MIVCSAYRRRAIRRRRRRLVKSENISARVRRGRTSGLERPASSVIKIDFVLRRKRWKSAVSPLFGEAVAVGVGETLTVTVFLPAGKNSAEGICRAQAEPSRPTRSPRLFYFFPSDFCPQKSSFLKLTLKFTCSSADRHRLHNSDGENKPPFQVAKLTVSPRRFAAVDFSRGCVCRLLTSPGFERSDCLRSGRICRNSAGYCAILLTFGLVSSFSLFSEGSSSTALMTINWFAGFDFADKTAQILIRAFDRHRNVNARKNALEILPCRFLRPLAGRCCCAR